MAQSTLTQNPLVSVVTPFYNSAPYLAHCIESVLAQTYSQFEYILLDNCSTDGSTEIAATYASRDPRIKFVRCSEFLSQLENYNRALTYISTSSVYCKMVQADDWLFPDCLKLMVRVFDQSESIGLVSSYWLEGDELCGRGLPITRTIICGREWARHFLLTDRYIFGSQTQVMYRSSLVRTEPTFYNTSFPFGADVEKSMEILQKWDTGFAHQILSFSRRDNEGSILGSFLRFYPHDLLRYVIARRHAPIFFDGKESEAVIDKYKRAYYRVLATAPFRLQGRAFWRYHVAALNVQTEGETLDWSYLGAMIAGEILWSAGNPGMTAVRILRLLNQKRALRAAEAPPPQSPCVEFAPRGLEPVRNRSA
jgi:glycosyltransferase involved in cell wall biosynthesis